MPGDLLADSVAAVSVGIVGGEAALDLCYEEDAGAEVDFNVVMTGGGDFVEVQGTAEGTPFSRAELDAHARPGRRRHRASSRQLQRAGAGRLRAAAWRSPNGSPSPRATRTSCASSVAICADWPVEWVTVENHDPAAFPDVEETGETYLENALLKAHAGRRGARRARRSPTTPGIEVDALGGAPGPRSARYAGEDATDEQNLDAMLRAVRGVPSGGRTARYRCVAAIAWPDGRDLHADGTCEGALVVEASRRAGLRLRPDLRARGLGRDDGRAHRRAEGPHQPPGAGLPRARESCRGRASWTDGSRYPTQGSDRVCRGRC